MGKKPRRDRYGQTKLKHWPLVMLFAVGVGVLTIGVLHFLDYLNLRDRLIENRAMDIALADRAFLPDDLIETFADTGKAPYLSDRLGKINSQWEGVYDTFIYTFKNGNAFVLPSDGFSPDLRTDAQYYQPFKDGKPLVIKPYADDEGTWGGVLVPLGSTEKPSAVLGIRFAGYGWSDGLTTKAIDTGVIVVFSELLLAAVYVLIKKNRSLAMLGLTLSQRESAFKSLIESLPMGIAVSRSNDLIVNRKFHEILGIERDALTEDAIEKLIKEWMPNPQNGGMTALKKIDKPDGASVWVDICTVSARLSDNEHRSRFCIIDDVTQRVLTETALIESERSKGVILAHLPGMAYRCKYDREWTMLFVSEGCEKLTGYKPESLIMNREVSFNDLIVPEFREVLWREWERILSLKQPFQSEYEITAKDGSRKWVLEMGQGIFGEDGNVEALEGLIIDVTAKKMSEVKLKHMSDHDLLTGLYNRKFFEEELLRRQNEGAYPISVIVANIDGVRLINDTFGYAEGDRAIIEAADIIKRRCRENDVLARTGGDEFGIILPDTDARQAVCILDGIFKACERHNNLNRNRRFDISLALGCGTKASAHETVSDAVKEAEESMHSRKLLSRKSSLSTIMSSIMATMFERSQETEAHAERLSRLSRAIGEKLGLPQKSLVELELFSMLHDIGKVGIDDRILNKPGKLNDEEWAVMKRHPEIGYRIAKASPELEPIAEYILSHHERWDGNGYPYGLKGEQIPLLSRILAVADAYDAMTEDRVYRKALTKEQALDEIKRNAGTQFDPLIAGKFIECME